MAELLLGFGEGLAIDLMLDLELQARPGLELALPGLSLDARMALPPALELDLAGVALLDFELERVLAVPGEGGLDFLPPPDRFDEASAVFFYFGFDLESGWLIERQLRATSQSVRARAADHPEFETLDEAWLERATLFDGE